VWLFLLLGFVALRCSVRVYHGAQPERGYNTVLFIQLPVPRPVSSTLEYENEMPTLLKDDYHLQTVVPIAKCVHMGVPALRR
jgi:hypothetical protein